MKKFVNERQTSVSMARGMEHLYPIKMSRAFLKRYVNRVQLVCKRFLFFGNTIAYARTTLLCFEGNGRFHRGDSDTEI